jgi:hypothetical protein
MEPTAHWAPTTGDVGDAGDAGSGGEGVGGDNNGRTVGAWQRGEEESDLDARDDGGDGDADGGDAWAVNEAGGDGRRGAGGGGPRAEDDSGAARASRADPALAAAAEAARALRADADALRAALVLVDCDPDARDAALSALDAIAWGGVRVSSGEHT